MIQCNKCYADNRDDALYCRRCGEKFPDLADQILQHIIGQDRSVKVIRQLAEYYLMLKRNSSHGQRPDMDILLKGSSGTGKDFIANIIQEYFFKKGIVQKQMVMVDAADFEVWMDKKTTDDFKALGGGILFINNIHMLIHDNNNISPIDVLFSRMESWETDSTAGWDTYPIIIMAGHPINIDKFFKEKPAGLNRFAKVLDLQDMNADTLSRICQNCLEKDLPVSEEASQRIFGFFRNVIRNRKVDFRNAWEAIDKCNNIHYQAMIHHHSGVEPDDITGEVYEPRSLEDILAEIDSYVGIEEVKEEVHSIVRMVQKAKAENPNADVRLPVSSEIFSTSSAYCPTVSLLKFVASRSLANTSDRQPPRPCGPLRAQWVVCCLLMRHICWGQALHLQVVLGGKLISAQRPLIPY